ncbi:ATP-binding cassette sub-family G member 4 [Microplitis demolitor]|uniref:ATP-binding cassette sub-family G member 4 n=1 Tax=Microplitis demolitor TaxID=69319 RepID=UPI0004CD0680|nr:ATP-binding cassette sub-family G member 4 [Microplitis demolitor]XP_008550673.1 ATP-binding cassette sub-family G member 4 [Microplitis demolitor]
MNLENLVNLENGDENNGLINESSLIRTMVHIESSQTKNLLKQQPNASSINIDFRDLNYSVRVSQKGKCKREILRAVSGYFRACSLNGIIGPSGAGKTSLLSIICGFKSSNIRGNISVNGIKVDADVLRKLTCYIPQEFDLLPLLTTQETLYYSTRLKVSRNIRTCQDIVTEVAEKLGLLECLGTMAANLSGGEKKRLSIGVEIVTNPQVLVLDEPTSGLDSAASCQVISLIKKMSQSGCTIICAIHQPSSRIMTMFDNVLVLADGRDLYCGPQTSIVTTFKQAGFTCPPFYNICEFVIEAATGQRTGDCQLLKKFNGEFYLSFLKSLKDSSDNKSIALPINDLGDKKEYDKKNFSLPWINELQVLLCRAATCVCRDNTMTKLRLVSHIAIGLLLGLVFRDFGQDASKTPSNIASLFFFLLFLFFANAMPAVQMFPVEAAVFTREHLNNWYSLCTYYISKIITDLPLQILCPTCFLIIAYCLTGQPLECDRFIKVWLMCFLISILAQSFGILAGAAFNTHVGCFLVPALNIPMFLFAGFFIKLSEISSYFYPLSAISFFRYAFEGIMQSVYGNDRPVLNCTTDFCILRKPKFILSYMDMPSTAFPIIIVILCSWILIIHTLIYMVLKWRIINVFK